MLRDYRRSMVDLCAWLDVHGIDLFTIRRPIIEGYRHALARGAQGLK